MGKVIIQEYTTKNPITMIGEQAGICWGTDTSNIEKNYKRGLDCLKNNHGRTYEFPDIYAIIDGYSARVIREWYTHIGGAPTRLQASTRYIDYSNFEYVMPSSIAAHEYTEEEYQKTMRNISDCAKKLERAGIPKEDIAMILPLGMKTKIVDKRNLRNAIDMSRQRMCNRAYWEYKNDLFKDYCEALKQYSCEWAYIVDNYFYAKCEPDKVCLETKGCGKYPNKI